MYALDSSLKGIADPAAARCPRLEHSGGVEGERIFVRRLSVNFGARAHAGVTAQQADGWVADEVGAEGEGQRAISQRLDGDHLADPSPFPASAPRVAPELATDQDRAEAFGNLGGDHGAVGREDSAIPAVLTTSGTHPPFRHEGHLEEVAVVAVPGDRQDEGVPRAGLDLLR